MAWAALIPLAISAASAIYSGIQSNKARKEKERLRDSRPEISDSEFVDEQVDLARSELSRGQNTASRVALQKSMDSDFAAMADRILMGGGSVNNVADLFDKTQAGRMRLAMLDDDLRIKRINNLMAAGSAGENFRQQQFQFNQYAPWADNTQAAAAARAGANQQMWSSFSNMGASAMNYASTLDSDRKFKEYLDALKTK